MLAYDMQGGPRPKRLPAYRACVTKSSVRVPASWVRRRLHSILTQDHKKAPVQGGEPIAGLLNNFQSGFPTRL
jgi:hypothetical protein